MQIAVNESQPLVLAALAALRKEAETVDLFTVFFKNIHHGFRIPCSIQTVDERTDQPALMKPVNRGWRTVLIFSVILFGSLRCDKVSKDRYKIEKNQNKCADHAELVAAELAAHQAPLRGIKILVVPDFLGHL